mmetsp:Transcript_6869/g.11566  ORF Transcript_6869/g.11566 Transcript_6869/m.11566 type:complete len:132 (-) Transcript_6869:135-530(-)
MGVRIAEEMQCKLASQGITAITKLKLVRGAFFVVEVIIYEVSLALIVNKLGERSAVAGGLFNFVVGCLPSAVKATVEIDLLSKKVAQKLAAKLSSEMQEKFAERGVRAETVGLSPTEEGIFLLDKLASLRR